MAFLGGLFGGGAPTAPNPRRFPAPAVPKVQDLVSQQQKANAQAFGQSAIGQSSPFGSATFQRDAQGRPIGQNVSLSPEIQPIFNRAATASGALLNTLPTTAFDPSKVPQGIDLQNNFYNQQMGLLNPTFEAQNKAAEVRAAERGLPLGSEAYSGLMDPIKRAQEQATQQAAFGAVQLTPAEEQRQLQNALTIRGLPFQEAQQSLGLLNAVPTPNFAPTPQAPSPINVAGLTTDIYGLQRGASNDAYSRALDQYNARLKQYQDQQAGISSLVGTGASLLAAPFTGGLSLAALPSMASSLSSGGAPAPYAGNPYNLPWLS